jgi:carbamoyl-phosphate synthase small subunit
MYLKRDEDLLNTKTNEKKAILALEDGSYFEGIAFGAITESQGEVCFNTSMTGYQEILTDPSYSGQIVTMTYPEIGNYGVQDEDTESGKVQAAGFIVKNCCEHPSNWRSGSYQTEAPTESTLDDYLKRNGIPGLKGIDTRKLVRILRDKGSQNGILVTGDYELEDVLTRAKKVPSMTGQDLASKVTIDSPYNWDGIEHPVLFEAPNAAKTPFHVVTMDFGLKHNILRKLQSRGAKVTVVPSNTSSEDILKLKPDGVMLSNGPGDPEPVGYAIKTIQELVGQVPIFGICLGHQLLSIALGAKTYKLKFGHRGANHPIKNLQTGEVAITSQNHGFAVDADSVNTEEVEITHINLNDQTVAGIRHKVHPAFSVQYHPEASPGPQDSNDLFESFVKSAQQFQGNRG